MAGDFDDPRAHGFARLSAAVPAVRVADPVFNAERTVEQLRAAHAAGADVVAFPELGLTGYSIDDLLHQDALLAAALTALETVAAATAGLDLLVAVGMPLVVEDGLYNCAVVLHDGAVLGVAPKSYLPNYREFYEKRHFVAARDAAATSVELLGSAVPFGADLVFTGPRGLAVHVEVCEDMWVPIPPSTYAALAGANVLLNLSASNITVGKAQYRQTLCSAHSARCVAAHVYVSAGYGESTTDLAWDGDAMISENGRLLARSERFAQAGQLVVADVDLDVLRQDRTRMNSYRDQATDLRAQVRALRRVTYGAAPVGPRPGALLRSVPRFPFVPSGVADREARCREVLDIQIQGLCQRMESSGMSTIIIGVSGGLDSTLALLVAAEAMDLLGLPRAGVMAYTMPGFATGEATRSRAHELMAAIGVTAHEVDIRPSCMQMLADIDHPFARGEKVYDLTFENVQAGERTSHLFRLAGRHHGLVLGTGDLSELALGWCTYGVGDQMSHYNVNASVPKTLIQHLIRAEIASPRISPDASGVLAEIIADTISPELIPVEDGQEVQSTEATIGPYELHDFFLYHLTRFGMRPSKIAYLALQAWGDRQRGDWSDLIAPELRNQYTLGQITHWLELFLTRFMRSQFKRTAMPNAPKVGSGGSLSPRGDWRAPSDASANAWLQELRAGVPR